MPRMLQIHQWWNEFSLPKSLLRGVQHSDPYSRMERMQAWYTAHFVSTLRSLFPNTALRSAPKALQAWATLLSTSSSTLPDCVINDPRYVNWLTFPTSFSPTHMGASSTSVASLPDTINFCLGHSNCQTKVSSHVAVLLQGLLSTRPGRCQKSCIVCKL